MNLIGKQIDHYRIIEQLGQGGMAIIYKAYDTRLERDVAIKVIRTTAIPAQQHERLLKRFEREAKAQAQFKHPNIVPIFDYGIHEGSPYLAMAYVPGGTLKDRIHGPMDFQQAVQWILPIADALQYAHELGIVHRDVKPSNILINQDNQPILTDFGIAKVLDSQESTLTGTGMGVGTPDYMAPEQWKGQSTEASDQYALGVVLYELLTGQKPYAAETPVAIALKQMNDPLTRPSTLAPGIPEQVEKVLFKALAKNPQDRYPTLTAFQQALADAAGMKLETRKTEKRTDVEKPTPSVKTKKKHTLFWVVASVVIVAAAVIGFLGFSEGWENLFGRFGINPGAPTDELSSVVQSTATPTPLPSPTLTPEPSPTITQTPTVTPIPDPVYSFNYINKDYQMMHYDLSTGNITKIMDIVPSENQNAESVWEKFIAAWTISGKYMVYSPAVPGSSNRLYDSLYLYDLLNQEEIIINDSVDRYQLLGFSPNETKFAYSSNEKGVPGLFVFDIRNQSSAFITHTERLYYAAEWNKDSTELYFASDQALYKYNFLTNEKETVVESQLGFVVDIILSPDDSQLYLYCTEDVTQWISIIDLTTNELHRITSTDPYWDFTFWKWDPEDSTITGSWIGNGESQGRFTINTKDYQIEFENDENGYRWYSHVLILETDEFSIFQFIDYYTEEIDICLNFYTNPEFNLVNQICSNDFSNASVSEDHRYLFIQRGTNQIHQIDLINGFSTTIITLDDGVLWFDSVNE